MTEHQEALEKVRDQIIENFGNTDDPVELDKLEMTADIGSQVAGFLQSEVADEGSWVDTGYGFGQYDCHVTVKGREYDVLVSAGATKAELDAWEAALGKSEDQERELLRRVLEALRVAGHYDLATEFEAQVSVAGIGGASDQDAAQVGRHPEGQDPPSGLGERSE